MQPRYIEGGDIDEGASTAIARYTKQPWTWLTAMLEDPGWQDFLRDSTGLLEKLHSTIMLPAPHSPLK